MNIIETENLIRRFGRVTALQGVTLTVPAGSIFAILGPNGAGKTTMLETLMNILEPTEGVARVLGCDSRHLGPLQLARIGYVSENQNIDERLKISELLTFVRDLYPTWDQSLEQKLLKTFKVTPERRFKELSRGMRIRALFVAALSFRPDVLLLDEPFSGLDPLMRDDLLATVIDLVQEDGRTVLLSSHDVEEVERIADRVAFFESGNVMLTDSVEAMRARYKRVVIRLSPEAAQAIVKKDSWLCFKREGEVVSFVSTQIEQASEDAWEGRLGDNASIITAQLSLKDIYLAHARDNQARKE